MKFFYIHYTLRLVKSHIWSDFETGMRKIGILCFRSSYIIRFIVNNLTHYGYFINRNNNV